MKQLIMNVLEDMSRGQVNLESKSARETIANSILVAMKTNNNGNGWFLDLSTLDGEAKLTSEELEVYESDGDEIAKALGHMDTDGNYITEDMPEGLRRAKELSQEAIQEGMRRTKSEMQLEHEDKVFDTAGEEVEPVNSYFTADVKDERDLEDQKFGGDTGTDADFNIPPGEEVDGMYFDDEVKEWEEAVGYKEDDDIPEGLKRAKELSQEAIKEELQKRAYLEMTSDGLPEGGDTQAVLESHKLADEIVDNQKEKWIYESPDGGKTVFRRPFADYDAKNKEEIDWETKEPTGRKFTEYNGGKWNE